MKIKLAIIFFVITILISSTILSAKTTKNSINTSDENVEWTIMLYLDGDNNLESYAIEDFLEIAAVGSTDNVNIIIQFDRRGGYDYSFGDWTSCKRYFVLKNMEPIYENAVMDVGEANMGDPQALVDFTTWTMENFPANKYSLIFWDHGTGWKEEPTTKNVCQDDTNGDVLDLYEIQMALNQITGGGVYKLEHIGFDACLMGMIEVAYELKDYANFMTFSEETEPADGWNYYDALNNLIKNPVNYDGEKLGESFVTYYSGYGITLSTINLGLINEVKNAVNNFTNKLMNQEFKVTINNAIKIVQTFDDYDYVDLYDFAKIIQADIYDLEMDNKAQELMDSINIAVTSEHHDSCNPDSHGLSIYLPYYYYLEDYENLLFSHDSVWNDFIIWFMYGDQTSSPPTDPIISGEKQGDYGNLYTYSFYSEDADGDDILYYVDWGDYTDVHEIGPKKSGEIAEKSHIWEASGGYVIKAQAIDINGARSQWTYYTISMPREKNYNFFYKLPIFQRIFNSNFFIRFINNILK